MILVSGPLAAVDSALAPYIQRVHFHAPDTETIKRIFGFHLDRLGPDQLESRDEILGWVIVASQELRLPFGEIRAIYRDAVDQAKREKRRLNLQDMIRAYTTKTGRPDEWNLATDEPLYGNDQAADDSVMPGLAEQLVNLFGPLAAIPRDGRLELAFSTTYYGDIQPQSVPKLSRVLSAALQELANVGNLKIVDWGWPKGLWAATEGCLYELKQDEDPEEPDTPVPDPLASHITPQQQWNEAGFTFGPRNLENDARDCTGASIKPWRRLVYVVLDSTMAQHTVHCLCIR